MFSDGLPQLPRRVGVIVIKNLAGPASILSTLDQLCSEFGLIARSTLTTKSACRPSIFWPKLSERI